MSPSSNLIIVRGAGDLATGTLLRLYRSGYPVIALETDRPSAIRRTVAFSEAIYEGQCQVEDVQARRVENFEELLACTDGPIQWVPIIVDAGASILSKLRPAAVVDAILAKRNLGTHRGMASFVLGLGPGFIAGGDVDAVIETNRGHNLGRVIWEGGAEDDTGQPGEIGGESDDRVLRAEVSGIFHPLQEIGDSVFTGQVIAYIENDYAHFSVYSKIDGILRGLIRPGFLVEPTLKIADVDPRGKREYCLTVSDKARSIGGGILEALLARNIMPSPSTQSVKWSR